MFLWCSNCQNFLGETPPYESLSITFTECGRCHKFHALTEKEQEKALRRIMFQLWRAGTSSDFEAGAASIEEALLSGFRPIDITMGILTPLLYQMGEEWAQGRATYMDEHRFTAFIEMIFETLRQKFQPPPSPASAPDQISVLLFNADNNQHNIGIRLLEYWFRFAGLSSKAFWPQPSHDEVLDLISKHRPSFVGFSISLPEQLQACVKAVDRIQMRFGLNHPQIIVGGHAVKMGTIPSIRGAVMIPDVRMLTAVLHQEQRDFLESNL
jgi:methanogenic corrinoid protein MtbC1